MVNMCVVMMTLLAFVTITAGIIMALCVSYVMPLYVTDKRFYSADDNRLDYTQAIDICFCIASVFPFGTKERIKFKSYTENKERDHFAMPKPKRAVSAVPTETPYLAALEIPAYSDDKSTKIFACNGFIVGPNQVVTSRSCVKDEEEFLELTARAGSAFWSTDGTVYNVKNYTLRENSFVFLTIDGVFPKETIGALPDFKEMRIDETFSVGWEETMYENSLKQRYKYSPYNVQIWGNSECPGHQSHVCSPPTSIKQDCQQMSSKPLISVEGGLFLGMQMTGSDECREFRSYRFLRPNCFTIYEAVC